MADIFKSLLCIFKFVLVSKVILSTSTLCLSAGKSTQLQYHQGFLEMKCRQNRYRRATITPNYGPTSQAQAKAPGVGFK